jgi:hypothetical protein
MAQQAGPMSRMRASKQRSAASGFIPPHLVMERLSRMSPEERRRMLDRLPPEKRKVTEERLRQFDAMPAPMRDRLRKEYNDFQSLAPEKQQELRGLFHRFSGVPEDRRQEMRRELNRLRSMPPARRAERIGEEAFRSEFNDDEREILQGLVEILPPPPSNRGLRRRPDKAEPVN